MHTLRFITCGSVDDGKSTLIGRLLYESKSIFEDQLRALEKESKQYGTQGEKVDFALLVDGLESEREQGITIDVAYRFFSTKQRKYIVADTPGHEQYTRNMATGASTADVAVILIDARKGVLAQTKRHSRIVSMMGIKHVIVAVNKMDLVGYSETVFLDIESAYREFAVGLGFAQIQAIPLCALEGDNMTKKSVNMPWFAGPSLLEYLDFIDVEDDNSDDFRMPVQYINRPNLDFRGFCGRIAEGRIKAGDGVRVLPSGVTSSVKEIVVWQGSTDEAVCKDSVTLVLADEVDVGRGDVIVAANSPIAVSDQFEARVLWMSEHAMVPGRAYILKIHAKETTTTVTHIKHKIDANSGANLAAKHLEMNEIGVVKLSASQPFAFEPYSKNRILGGFILIDRLSFETVGAGMIDFALRRADNIHWQSLEIDKNARAAIKMQKPKCIWLTGLSGSGKSTIANLLEKRLHIDGRHTYILDGDNVRHGLNRDLGFTEDDRVENIRRVAEVAKLMVDAGLIVIVSFISPFEGERAMARELFEDGEFIEVFVDTPIEECEARDVKGLYAKARSGELKNFTGIDSPYEAPRSPETHLDTTALSLEECVSAILKKAF